MATAEETHVLETPSELFQAAAEQFAAQAKSCVETSGRFCVALSGGSTPKSLYSLLASGSFSAIPWEKIYFFFGDERDVPPDHPDSNYRMANEAMLSKVPVPRENIFRVHTEMNDAEAAALDYERTMRAFFRLEAGGFPRFDLILLGMGPDGHTASLFPGTAALNETSRLVVANWVEQFKSYRITLTLPVLNHAASVTFLVSGANKADMVREVLEEHRAELPSTRIRPTNGRLVWLLDSAAAAGLASAHS
jgi:6-phosphogluconolactonase